MGKVDISRLPVVPLEEGVVLPHMVVTVQVERPDARAAFAEAGDGHVLLVPLRGGDFARIGTVAKIEDRGKLPGGEEVLVVRGLHRAVIGTGVAGAGEALWVEVRSAPDPSPSARAEELGRTYKALVESIIEQRGGRGIPQFLEALDDPGRIADASGYSPSLSDEKKIEVLETLDVEERLEKLIRWGRETLAELAVKEKIRSEVADGMEKTQREFFLRRQLEAIRKELGDEDADVISEYRDRLEEARMPEAVRNEVERELARLERMGEQNPEHGWIRTYVDWMLELPWDVRSDDSFDVAGARVVLNEDHTGLDDVKERIVEFLAVKKLRAERGVKGTETRGGAGATITLVGPPGVGKTSMGESIARAMGRKFVRVALGGVRDEAEIRGHRRTYVGALPGRIARALKEAGTKNPVILLDEIDKVGSDWRGDPSSALLEVLDPAQNHTFRDHYLEVDLDLSEVLFIPTANVLETIPAALLDRMEVVRLDGYTDDEKLAIVRNHLLPRRLADAALGEDEVSISDEAIRTIITDHTREAGVRNLERELGKVLRKAATSLVSGETEPPVHVDAGDITSYLGRARFHHEAADRTQVPGVATGLAVTGMGGDVLFIEATTLQGEDRFTLTGQLGDVMKESARIALSYVRSRADDLGIAPAVAGSEIHLHVPAGAVPKDGPSAGITMVTAVTSLLTGRAVRPSVGMTGEVTLQGRVLPIGGVKQKVLAAHRSGLREVVLPLRNEPDLEDVPAAVREEMEFHLVEDVAQVLEVALEQVQAAA